MQVMGRAVVLLSLILSSATVGVADVTLAWKFEPGQASEVELTQRVETETQLGSKPVRVIVDTTLVQRWTVVRVEADGAAHVDQQFERIAVKLELPQGSAIVFDSAATKKPTAEAKELAAALGPLVGTKLQVTLAANGELRDVQLDEALTAHLASMPADSNWKQMFSREGLRQWMRQAVMTLPAEPVAPEATWQRQLDLVAPLGKIRQTSDYRYVGSQMYEGTTVERIDVTSKVELTPIEGGGEPPTIKQQSQTGQILFDAKAGRLIESQSTQKLRTEARVRDTVVSVGIVSQLKTRITPKQ